MYLFSASWKGEFRYDSSYPQGYQCYTGTGGKTQLLSPGKQTCLARQNIHLGLWKTQVLASQFSCTNAFTLCSIAFTTADGAEAPAVMRLLILMMNVTKLLGVWGFLAACLSVSR